MAERRSYKIGAQEVRETIRTDNHYKSYQLQLIHLCLFKLQVDILLDAISNSRHSVKKFSINFSTVSYITYESIMSFYSFVLLFFHLYISKQLYLTFILEMHLRESHIFPISGEGGVLELTGDVLLSGDARGHQAVVHVALSAHQINDPSSVTDDSDLVNVQHGDRQLSVEGGD